MFCDIIAKPQCPCGTALVVSIRRHIYIFVFIHKLISEIGFLLAKIWAKREKKKSGALELKLAGNYFCVAVLSLELYSTLAGAFNGY